jgi:hypothetical protein
LEEVAHFRRFKGKCFESKAKLKAMVQSANHYDVSAVIVFALHVAASVSICSYASCSDIQYFMEFLLSF